MGEALLMEARRVVVVVGARPSNEARRTAATEAEYRPSIEARRMVVTEVE